MNTYPIRFRKDILSAHWVPCHCWHFKPELTIQITSHTKFLIMLGLHWLNMLPGNLSHTGHKTTSCSNFKCLSLCTFFLTIIMLPHQDKQNKILFSMKKNLTIFRNTMIHFPFYINGIYIRKLTLFWHMYIHKNHFLYQKFNLRSLVFFASMSSSQHPHQE